MKILVLNAGSSSLKYQVIDMDTEEMLVKGNYERIGQSNSFLTHKVYGVKHKFEHYVKNHEEALKFIMSRLFNDHYGVIKSLDELAGIGNRVVHGGEKFKNSCLITEDVIEAIEECSDLAPLHNPNAISGIRACQKVVPNVPMVAVFDTSFHQTIPKERYIYPIPYEYYEKYSIRKYGFHGISHQYVATRVSELLNEDIKDLKIVSCHLGQGASVCAIKNGKSVETSMGLTPLGGLAMGSRSGDLDPSVVTSIMKKEELTPIQMEEILNKKSGVYGISRVSLDFRDIEAEALAGGTHAKLALEVFDYIVAEHIAKCAVAMGGIDVITFEAGVGEKGPLDRANICNYLKVFGVELDEKANETKGEEIQISTKNSKVKVFVIPTNEELMIARETLKAIRKEV
ncbi:MAG: acetate kinase [Clostridia bacterium]|nr:acetate kinase [Clostridia bacterium]